MSISALTSEAARLLAYFQGAESSINAQVAAAVAAVPGLYKSYFIDPVSGSDDNPGTSSAAPYATIGKALLQHSQKSGLYIVLNLARDRVHNLDFSVYIHNSSVYAQPYGDTALPKPVLQLVENIDINTSGNQVASCYGVGGHNSYLTLHDIHVKTVTFSPELAALPIGSHCSLVRPMGGVVRFGECETTLNDSPLLQLRGPGDAALFSTVTINTPGDGRLIWLSDSPISMFFGGITLTGAKTLDDLVATRRYSTSGYPLNFICNYDFGGA